MADVDDTTPEMKRKAKHAAYMKAHRAANPEMYKRIDGKAYRKKKERDPVGYRAAANVRDRKYYAERKANPPCEAERERLKAAARERNRKYRENNRERLKKMNNANAAKRYAANPEKFLAAVKKYQATPKGQEVLKANARKRRALEKKAGGVVTAADWNAILAAHDNRCNYCKKDLAIKKGDATMDHVIPLTKGGRHSPENVVPACRSCNSKKYNKIPTGVAS